VLVDWNLGNFSVVFADDDSFRLFSRWDYDWFRIEPRLHDFYFLSRVSSATGDRTQFTYSSHTLVEPRFERFIAAYHAVNPLSEDDIRFLPEAYRFFLLNYVIREGARFFRSDYCERFRRESARVYLPGLDHLDITPLLRAIGA
jgi:Ser/Thr protein kinase RdoA (MazF antagonist)